MRAVPSAIAQSELTPPPFFAACHRPPPTTHHSQAGEDPDGYIGVGTEDESGTTDSVSEPTAAEVESAAIEEAAAQLEEDRQAAATAADPVFTTGVKFLGIVAVLVRSLFCSIMVLGYVAELLRARIESVSHACCPWPWQRADVEANGLPFSVRVYPSYESVLSRCLLTLKVQEGVKAVEGALMDLKASVTAGVSKMVAGTLCLSAAGIQIRGLEDGFGFEPVLHTIDPEVVTFTHTSAGGVVSFIVKDRAYGIRFLVCFGSCSRMRLEVMSTRELRA
jgi:hypothetical protein